MEQFDQQIEDCYWRVATTLQHASEPPLQQKVATESLNELRTRLKELQVLQEALRQQNEELVAEHQALEAERQRYQELFEFAPDAYLVTDPQGVIQAANYACTTLLKWQQILVGKPLIAFVAKRERLSFHSKLIRLQQVDGVKDWEVRLCPTDGEPIDSALNVAVVRNQEGKPVALRWLLRDITKRKRLEKALYQVNEALNKEITSRKQTEQALRESEERFRFLLENALDTVTVLDADGTVVYASPSWERVLGYKSTKLIEKKLVDYIHPDDVSRAINSFTNAIVAPGVTLPIELSFQHQDGSWRVLEAISKNFIDQLGHRSVVVNCRDITERKQIEKNRLLGEEKELSQLKLCFFSLASHEFRTPLSTILVSAQLLGCSPGEWSQEKRLRNVQRIEAAAKHMTQLLDDILTINRAKTHLL